jgi:hypothetical protein
MLSMSFTKPFITTPPLDDFNNVIHSFVSMLHSTAFK